MSELSKNTKSTGTSGYSATTDASDIHSKSSAWSSKGSKGNKSVNFETDEEEEEVYYYKDEDYVFRNKVNQSLKNICIKNRADILQLWKDEIAPKIVMKHIQGELMRGIEDKTNEAIKNWMKWNSKMESRMD